MLSLIYSLIFSEIVVPIPVRSIPITKTGICLFYITWDTLQMYLLHYYIWITTRSHLYASKIELGRPHNQRAYAAGWKRSIIVLRATETSSHISCPRAAMKTFLDIPHGSLLSMPPSLTTPLYPPLPPPPPSFLAAVQVR